MLAIMFGELRHTYLRHTLDLRLTNPLAWVAKLSISPRCCIDMWPQYTSKCYEKYRGALQTWLMCARTSFDPSWPLPCPTQNDDAKKRTVTNIREFARLERREQEYLTKIGNEAEYRRDPGARKIKSSVGYNILAPNYRPAEDLFGVKLKKWTSKPSTHHIVSKCKTRLSVSISCWLSTLTYATKLCAMWTLTIVSWWSIIMFFRWHACMRSLRLQSKQSGARMYNVMTWKPQKPCCIPPPKPEQSDPPEEIPKEKPPAERPPSPARPRNILHSLDRVEDVPIGSTQDNRTNW